MFVAMPLVIRLYLMQEDKDGYSPTGNKADHV